MLFLVTGIETNHYIIKDLWDKIIEVPYDSKEYIPVLHSLSKIYNPIRVNNKTVVPAELLCEAMKEQANIGLGDFDPEFIITTIVRYFQNLSPCRFPRDLMSQAYYILNVLHFDLTGLIEKKEALAIETLKFDPYEFDSVLI